MEIGTGPRMTIGTAAAELPGLLQPARPITARLRSWLSRPPASDDPVADLIRLHRTTHPRADANLIRQAYEVAEQAHRGQMRKSGEEYISHPLATARILAELGMDTTTMVAALLSRHGRRHIADPASNTDAIRRDRVSRRRWRHQTGEGVLGRRGRGRDRPQNDDRGGPGRPGIDRQTGRPRPQHAHAAGAVAVVAQTHRPSHPRRARSTVRPARNRGP